MTVSVLQLDIVGRIELLSFSWGHLYLGDRDLFNQRVRGRGNFTGGISFMKMLDRTSPLLMNYVVTGDRVSEGTLTVVGDELFVLTFTDIVFTSVALSGSNENPMESYEMEFEGFKSKYAHLANGPLGFLNTQPSRTTVSK